MVKRYAIIENGVVVNVIEILEKDVKEFAEVTGMHLVQGDTANIGDTWDGKNFIPPAPPQSE